MTTDNFLERPPGTDAFDSPPETEPQPQISEADLAESVALFARSYPDATNTEIAAQFKISRQKVTALLNSSETQDVDEEPEIVPEVVPAAEEPDPLAAPESEKRRHQAIAVRRADRVLEALEDADRIADEYTDVRSDSTRWEASYPPSPGPDVLSAMLVLLRVVASDRDVLWPQQSWPFLGAVATFAKVLSHELSGWFNRVRVVDIRVFMKLSQLQDFKDLLHVQDGPIARTVELEPLEDLVEQKVSDHQIAKIYGWFNSIGEPDYKRVQLARKALKAGKLEESGLAPELMRTYTTHQADAMQFQPDLSPISVVFAEFNKWKDLGGPYGDVNY